MSSAFYLKGDSTRKTQVILLVGVLVALLIPAIVTAVPSGEPTQEEIEKEKEIQENAGAKGWWYWRTIPDRNKPPEYPNDIYPILYKRGHLLGTDLFDVKYKIYSHYTSDIQGPWTDRFWLDRDTGMEYCVQTIPHTEWDTIKAQQATIFQLYHPFHCPWRDYWDMNIHIDINDNIPTDGGDYRQDNNKDWEYMLFWWW